MKKIIFILLLFSAAHAHAQELFVYTEPASNMAAKSMGVRMTSMLMKDIHYNRLNYHLTPELMWGVSRKIMLHADAFFSNMDGNFAAEGGSIYLKYRFFTIDAVHNHFRVAAFGKYSFNNSFVHSPAIDLNGHNSGYEGGMVATQLINKVALSAGSSVLHATDNGNEKFLYGNENRTVLNYTFSVGRLMLPKEYTDYKQTNLNIMIEFLGQSNLNNGYNYLDIAPSLQLIFNSKIRVDIGYRYPLVSKLFRSEPEGALLRLEYNFFNVY